MARVTEWEADRLTEPVTVADMARVAAVSPATLHRAFRAELGTTPLAWFTRQRVDRACELLEQTPLPVEAVARVCGLGTAANLRTRIREAMGLTPTERRRQFSAR